MDTNRRLRILYIEDNCDSIDMLTVMLAMSDIEVDCALSVSDGLARAAKQRYDLYLLDSGLPDGDGLALCRTLRFANPDIPVLFYSGNAHSDDIKRGMSAGASGYVTKPHSDRLAPTIILLVENQRARAASYASLPVLAVAA